MSNELAEIERQLEQTEDDEMTINLLYRKTDILQSKANKYDSLVEKIKKTDLELARMKAKGEVFTTAVKFARKNLQELLDTEEE